MLIGKQKIRGPEGLFKEVKIGFSDSLDVGDRGILDNVLILD